MAKRVIQPNDEEIARRAMDLARQVTGRVFVSPSGPCLVSGSPEFRKLRHCLAGLSQPPPGSTAPTPMDLGFAPHQITPLNGERLSAWGRGLQKWRKILDDYETPRQKTTERRQKYRRWKDEIDQIAHDLEGLWQTFRRWDAGEQIDDAPYVRVATAGWNGNTATPFVEPLWSWFEHLVFWVASEAAGRRFHQSLAPMTENRGLIEKRRHFARVLPRLKSLRDRHQDISSKELAAAVRDAVASIPDDVQAEFGFSIPSRPRDFHIADIVAACSNAAADHLPPPSLVGSAAALCATDGAATTLAAWLFSSCDGDATDARIGAFKSLFEEHGKTGYEKLLDALLQMPGVSCRDFDTIRQFLVAGVDANDIIWALQNLGWRVEELAKNGLSPQPFRTLVSALEQAGLKLDSLNRGDTDLEDVVERVAERKSTNIIEAFAMWLPSLGPGSLDANLARWAWNCLCQLLILEGASPAFRDALRRWADPAVSEDADPVTTNAPPEVRAWLSRLSYYQELCGKEPSLPDSVARLLGHDGRQDRELEYLRKARDDGQLNERMAARLTLLESRDGTAPVSSDERLIKQLREVCAHMALDAVKHLAHREARRVWEQLCGCTPPPHLTEDETTAIAAWATGLDEKARGCLRELIDGWGRQGMGYRRNLSANRAWVETASHRMNIEAWFTPEPCEIDIDGLPVTIGAAPDPFRVFLMGSYFGTCLSLDDFNKDSVLANAYDANKSVVFALGTDGQVLARKLVCIGSDYKLIGYRTYVAGDEVITKVRREGLVSTIDAFCGRWAQRAGLPLGFAGKPAKVSGLFWYDDGIRSWAAAAMRVWADPQAEINVCTAGAGLMPPLAEALGERCQECINLLTELGIWPPFGCGGDVCLESVPGLAEESLALLARTVEDRRLARLVFENATTTGGQIEAVTSVTMLEKTDDMVEHVFSIGRRGYELGDRAMEVLRQVASQKAWRLFMEKAVRDQDEPAHNVWLPLAAADSADSANALVDALLATTDCRADDRQLLLAAEMLAILGRELPRAVVVRALASERSGPGGRLSFAQWCPDCPDALKRPNVQRIARTEDDWDGAERYAAMAAVVVAMKNQGAKATAYLRETATRAPSALLALALQDSGRHREFIRKMALAAPTEPAAILALLESEGMDRAAAVLAPTMRDLPGQDERWGKAVALRNAFHELDAGRSVSCLPGGDRFGDALPLLPYVLAWLLKWTDSEHPNVPALAALTASENFADFLRATGTDTLGLAARMASLLRQADGEPAADLQQALHAILKNETSLRNGEYALLLGKLSGHKLWTEPPQGEQSKLSAEDAVGCSGAWGLLMDDQANHRPVVKWIEFGHFWDIRFPLDSRLAGRAMELLAASNPTKDQAKEIRPLTEIERQLLLRHIPSARP
ncbi:MAG: hypothetical protein BWX73_02298 [Lentisphaerae bacterium ADurb.Bin082]|nr:MAG: hypothetical protein BWX73_02298 [Lentisphaerae bacterium ADurb.Bin082]